MSFDTFKKVFSNLAEKSGYSDAEIARRLGVNRSTISRWKSGEQSPPLPKVKEIADFFGVNPMVFVDEFHGAISVKAASVGVPLYGSIAAGVPLEMIQIEEYIEIPEMIGNKYPDAFLLRVNGDSMNKVVPNGMYALIAPNEEIKNGDVVAINVNGYEATLKRFFKLHNTIVLEPDSYNPEHTPMMLDCTKAECEDLKVLGKMVWFMSPLNAKF
jgi:repressor LexA